MYLPPYMVRILCWPQLTAVNRNLTAQNERLNNENEKLANINRQQNDLLIKLLGKSKKK